MVKKEVRKMLMKVLIFIIKQLCIPLIDARLKISELKEVVTNSHVSQMKTNIADFQQPRLGIKEKKTLMLLRQRGMYLAKLMEDRRQNFCEDLGTKIDRGKSWKQSRRILIWERRKLL
ncbi:hypothetical protein AVEN_100027-1 [Araneus ventricosus]|uniref:Uncharacterized protein n=1 Tax=Araneus ventricosus TaxID=182803 RepID=A0A4Y2NYK1_ARAVE|nr:hypothetical protein AVEN_100027-1 [Araneus ventricosus]